MFMRDGFTKVSMAAIAAAVPVSKPTLYNNFSDKKKLFAEVILHRCNDLANKFEENIRENTTPEAVLSGIGNSFLNMVLTPESIKIHRTMIAECAEFPEMAELFYKSGPERIHSLLEKYLKKLDDEKKLLVENPAISAAIFLNSLKGQPHMQCLLGMRKSVTAEERKEIIDYAVRHFIKAHSK